MKRIILLLLGTIIISACTLPGLGGNAQNNDIVIASGNTTERQIVNEIVAQMIVHYMPNVEVTIINNLGSSLLINQALTRRDANVSGVMYTGTSLTGELGQPATSDTQKALQIVKEGYYSQFDMVWLPSYGFENSYAFMVTENFSRQNNITKVSQLASLSDSLSAGVDASWMNRDGDGYNDFKRIYNFDFEKVYPMEIGLVYDAVQSGAMDVVLGYSTDGRIDSNNLVILEDDLHLFPPYDASPVVSKELLEKYPELEPILLKLVGAISQNIMQQLNRESDDSKIEPSVVAKRFLEDNNYFIEVSKPSLHERNDYEFLNERGG